MIEKDIKEKIKKIYEVLPKLNDRRCGYRTCGEFAKAVAKGEAPCYGCVTGGYETARKVCAITGEKIDDKEKFSPKYNHRAMTFAGIPDRPVGRGRRYRNRYYNTTGFPGESTYNYRKQGMGPGQEEIILSQQADHIKKQLHDIEKRLKELEKDKKK